MAMQDGDFEVDILDDAGNVVGKKLRKDIIKGQDIYHAVYAIIKTPDSKFALSHIAQRQDLPNLHAGAYGFTAATIRRSGEDGAQAMKRAIANELKIDIEPKLFSESMESVDNTKRFVGLYIIDSEVPANYSRSDITEIVTFEADELTKAINDKPKSFTPLLKKFWRRYKK